MVRGKLQPALKYVAPQNYYNKYEISKNEEDKDKQAVITYPSTGGDIQVNKKHNDYVDALKNKRGWGDGEYQSAHQGKIDHYLNTVTAKRHNKQNKDKYHFDANEETRRGMQGDIVESDSDQDYYDLEDPRTVDDLEKENIALKE